MILFNQFRSLWLEIINFWHNYFKINQFKTASNHLKILLLMPYSPVPPHSGAAIRRLEQIRFLGSRYQVAIVSFISSDLEYDLSDKLKDFCFLAIPIRRREIQLPLFSKNSDLVAKFDSWNMRITLKRLRSLKFEVVLFDTIFMTRYTSLFSDSCRILLEHNIESTILARTLALAASSATPEMISKMRALQEYENKLWSEFPLRVVVSEIDQQEMDRRCLTGKTIVVKNGVDTEAILPTCYSLNAKKILFMGILSYEPNLDAIAFFIQEILPLIWQKAADFRFCIAGANPTTEVYRFLNDERIEIIANPEEMIEVAKACSLTVVPLRIGSGTRLKILQAMAMGLPVVSTSLGAEGLEVVNNYHLSICDHPQHFAESVLRLTSDLSFRSELQSNARKLVEERYNWRKIWLEFEREMLAFVQERAARILIG